mmetsp:Transcript_13510/g.25914  ORF Transcript_13510/g.25914 Transcript_13510/m.25914 type:complete len:102 (+) Transcript_13510:281-586(+)|eukprot:scaffold426_cov219-Amphora_coffeaeformis.AAC.28
MEKSASGVSERAAQAMASGQAATVMISSEAVAKKCTPHAIQGEMVFKFGYRGQRIFAFIVEKVRYMEASQLVMTLRRIQQVLVMRRKNGAEPESFQRKVKI